ncbi:MULTISPECIES: hypothetical protein [unclassified Streptomyces]|uniref:hypothetical protein n=1 Tax=unclassified Streptomyces TaxID=2593676 RepID=UPI0037F815D7
MALGTTAVLGFIAAPAQASSWTGHLTGAGPGYESRRWDDDGGRTNIKFSGCKDDYTNKSVAVTLFKNRKLAPDAFYSTQAFSKCFSGGTSSGWWEDHGSGSYYFNVNGALVGVHVWVASITTVY